MNEVMLCEGFWTTFDWSSIVALLGTAAMAYIAVKVPVFIKVVKETAEALTALSVALADGQLTKAEIQTVKKEFIDIVALFKKD